MAPIRVALVGLSQTSTSSWASSAHLPYLLSERGRQKFKIVALLNSSEKAALNAIKAYSLSSDTKAYGSPDDLAADSNVDLVVCSTRVDKHYDAVAPSLKAGKNVFVEWPLAENVNRARELATMAKQSGSKTMIGLQARVAPSIRKLKSLIEAGAIGKVLSSDIQGNPPVGGGDSISEGFAYFLDKKIGGNPVTIGFGHAIDAVHAVLGEYSTSHSQLQIQRPHQTVINRATGATKAVTSDVPDLISVHGELNASPNITKGATLSVVFRPGTAFPDTEPFVWNIVGEKGRIRLTDAKGGLIQGDGGAASVRIRVEHFATKEVRAVELEWEDWQVPLAAVARNIGKLYDLYYEGRTEESGVADFEGAVVRHAQLDEMLYPSTES